MFKPMLIGSALVGALTAPAVLAEQAPATQVQTPPPAEAATVSAPQLPAWVKERHAELGVPPGGQPSGMPSVPPEPPRIPEWVKERHSQAGQLPPPPPEIPAWVKEHRAQMSMPDAPQAPEQSETGENPVQARCAQCPRCLLRLSGQPG